MQIQLFEIMLFCIEDKKYQLSIDLFVDCRTCNPFKICEMKFISKKYVILFRTMERHRYQWLFPCDGMK